MTTWRLISKITFDTTVYLRWPVPAPSCKLTVAESAARLYHHGQHDRSIYGCTETFGLHYSVAPIVVTQPGLLFWCRQRLHQRRGIRTETTTSFFCRVAARTSHLTSHTSVKFRKRATLEKLSEAEDLVVRQRFACSLTSAISGAWLGATTRLTGGGRGGPWTGPPVGMVQCLSSLKMVARRAVPLDALSPSSSDSYGN